MKKIDVKIKLLSPAVLSTLGSAHVMTETHKFISGSILRGLFAQRYIEMQELGRNADEHAGFRHIFFSGARFVDANPICKGERAITLPMSLQKEKEGIGGNRVPKIQDLLNLNGKAAAKGFKSFRGMASVVGNEIYKANVKTVINFHMSRSGAKERLKGSSQDGGVYSYEAVCEGQSFIGTIIGEQEVLQKLVDGLNLDGNGFMAYIGVSKYTQYGKCSVELSEIEDLNEAVPKIENKVLLRLDTPYIPREKYRGNAEMELAAVIDCLNHDTEDKPFSLGQVFAGNVDVDNFVGAWNMWRRRDCALASGSVFEVKRKGVWTDRDLKTLNALMFKGIGKRREEGFGQLRIWSVDALAMGSNIQEKDTEIQANMVIPEAVKNQIKSIINGRIFNQLQIYAYEDAAEARIEMGTGMAHFFARLEQMLEEARKNKTSVQKAMSAAIKENKEHQDDKIHARDKAHTPFQEHLSKVFIRKKASLGEYLECRAGIMPYLDRDLHHLIKDVGAGSEEKVKSLLKLADGSIAEDKLADNDYFYTYWHWFFRYGRKHATKKPRRQ
ncbi:hypothetical protein [Selenomonas ruminantium]|uniref:hypothetical protein n=1 Tax=Selenomonas ruminantium TaxID=971 RepID=UPI000412DD93|nr:hypothetical protein [Selenomonas ruminantium]